MKTSNLPKISIVTPSYNQGGFLRETIESIVNQSYPNLEYFIIDGGSTDESVDIIREYEARIDWWVSEKDRGQSHAINKGFEKATGELLCWVNSDDILFPDCLHRVATCYLNSNKPHLIHTNFVHIDSDGVVVRMIRIPQQSRFFMYRGVWSVSAPSAFFSAELLHNVGYLNTDLHMSMDLDLWLRMMKAGARLLYISDYLGAFRLHQNSKTSTKLSSHKLRDIFREQDYIFDTGLSGTTLRSRFMWRMVWKIYQMINLNYLRSYIDTLSWKGSHWKRVFSSTDYFS